MKVTLMFSAAILTLLATAALTLGDIPAPKTSPTAVVESRVKSNLVVVPDRGAWTARLQIPRSSLRQLRAAIDNASGEDASALAAASVSTRTIMAGLCMFLALSFGGIWLVRSGQNRNQKALAGIVITAALLGATAMIARGNAAPPPVWKWDKLPQNLSGGITTTGPVDIEIVSEGHDIKLVVPMYRTAVEPKPGE